MISLCLSVLLAPVPVAAPDAPEITYFVFAGNDLADLRKELEGPEVGDESLAKVLKAGQGTTSLVLRVTKVNGKTTEIHAYSTRVKQPKIALVREKAFTPADPAPKEGATTDFKRLLKACGLSE